ncbi:serine hydrolase domain-containing protein [Paenibacillus apiarius]|uniref:Beta-lactamase family protein n=1 Tax=Paenibacillus apiarius TaxID=46240 RepID=A0ABT4DVP4_9BACL|nr:serine hydrolase [Paenibacillus apiarius]MCY9514805.1 beta-lactamase family protein [Paenibacillus apiarius]MCY9521315.1 beta-lactamase family protein [Paenibacillus apiarius]MCY9554031.1 beta-lactamase family protein [Paenibacillus apiarius]MCY9560405.1 beta-lactamase family protein [Paenibacillus apiarius]MCY9682257.1 beta-lactamase family protein [Paenibacillus apiarius]
MKRNFWPTKEWQAVDPATLRIDSKKLSELEPMIKAEYGNINGIVIVRNGSIAYERYYNGYGPDDAQHVASVTKSIISALIGIAIDAGYIKNIEQKVLDFFPEYVPDAADKQKREITIRHLLTMTAPYPFEDWHEPLDKMCMQPDWVTYTLDMLGQRGSIGAFKYSTAGAHLLSAIITRSTGQSAREFANERLFTPIGMKEIPDYEMKSFGFEDLFGKNVKGWVKDPTRNSTGGWGLTLSPRDMARFGVLYLNRGMWDNNQIIPGTWIDESTVMNPNHYGYLWWLREEDGVYAYSALGDGGNVICCSPDKDLVVAIASEFMMNPRDRWTLIKECIIPAVID